MRSSACGARRCAGLTVVRAYMRFVEHHVLAGADRIVAVSDYSREEIVRREPAAKDRVVLVPAGVDTTFFAPSPDRMAARTRLGLGPHERVAIVVGRLVPVKRYDRAIEVIAQLRAAGLDTVLLVVGQGRERPALERQAERSGVADLVRFLGFRSGAELRDAHWASDVQLCTSEFENLSLALIEGMAAGVPVAALPTGGTVGLLEAIDPGLLAPRVDASDLVPIVRSLLTDAKARDEAAARCRSYIVAQHDWESVVDRLEEVLRFLVGTPRT